MTKHNLAFVDIDTQYDFMMPQGTLYVPGAEEIVTNLARLIQHAQAQAIPVIASVDAHGQEDPEFKQFPPHCLRNTPGQAKIPATTIASAVVLPAQAQAFSLAHPTLILEKTIFSIFGNENAAAVFQQLEADRYVVFGVATDYCVKAAVLGLLARGHKVAVVTDAIRGVDAQGTQQALIEMQQAGATMVETAEVLNW